MTSHPLRHFFAAHLLVSGSDIRTVQELLGQKNVATPMIYTHVFNKPGLSVINLLDSQWRWDTVFRLTPRTGCMLLYYDLDAGQWVQSPGSRFSPAKPGFIRGDSAAITLKFCRGATIIGLDGAATASLGVKQDGKFDGSYLASTGTVVVANHSKAVTSTAHGTATTFLVPGHGRATGESVTITGDASTPPANGTFAVTVTDADHFSVPFTTTVGGTGGTMTPALEPSYSFAPSFNTAAIDTALGVQGGGGSTADDVSSLAGNLEVTWTVAGVIASTVRLPVTIWNDVNKGDEGAAEYSNPPYPAPNNVVTAYPLITGLTGGTVTDLDGQATIGGAKTAGHEAHLCLSGIASAWLLRTRAGETENSAAGRVIPDDDSTLLWEQIDVAAILSVVDAAARLALSTADVRNGDHVREVGQPEIVKLTCVGNTHTAAHTVAATTWVIDWSCTPDTAGDMAGTDFYMWRESTAEYVIFWFKVGGAGSAPDWGTEGDGVHYHEVAIAVDASAITVATAFKTALDAEMSAEITTTRTDDTIRMTWVTAGGYPDTGGNDTTWFESNVIEEGADEYEAPATDSLEGKLLTLQAASVTVASTSTPAIAFAKTVGFSVAGNVGAIPVTIPAAAQTGIEIAALVQVAVHAHARFHATVLGAEVIVTNAENGMVNTPAAPGDTGCAITVMQSGSTGALTYALIDRTEIASAAGWRELPCFVGCSAVSKPFAQNVADLTARRLVTAAQAPLGSKVITGSPYGAWIVVNESLLSPEGSTPGSDAAFGPNLLAQFTGETRMGYDYVEWDTHFQYDPLTSKFHCKVPGKYLLGVQVDMTQAASGNWRYIVQVRKNGILVKRLVDSMSTGYQAQADLNLNCSPLILALVAGDVVDVWGYIVGGYAIAYWDSSARAFWNVTRLGP